MAEEKRTRSDAPTIRVRITPVIEREFKRRNVFQDLRLENACHIENGASGVHKVSVEGANALLADAKAMQVHNHDLPRGVPAAYSALKRNVEGSLKLEARRGLWSDPGLAEAQKRMVESLARFEVGDAALYFHGDGYDSDEVVIVEGHRLYSIVTDSGPYIATDGTRIDYRPGYAVELKSTGRRHFAAAHSLTRGDCKPSHLRLVATS